MRNYGAEMTEGKLVWR